MNEPIDTFSDVEGEARERVLLDVVNGVGIEDSALPYTPGMRRYRRTLEREIAAMPAGAIVDVPNDLPPATMVVPE